jgi:hypothetical protein
LDDTPLKVESRDELPAVKVALELVIFCKTKIADSQKETIHNVPKLQECNFQQNPINMVAISRGGSKTPRTAILGHYSGIAEVYHPDRQEIEKVKGILTWEL